MTIAQRTCDDASQTLVEELADAVVVSAVSRLMGGNPPPVRLGQFALLRLLGRGGAGTVYQAEDTEKGRDVALKVLHDTPRGAAEAEYGALARLRHSGLPRYHGLHCIDGLHCVSMELVSGDTLRDRVSVSKRSAQQMGDIVRQISDALVFLHSRGITHGDIKPSNVMVAADGRVVLLDFGLASIAAPGERVRRRGRTAGYVPEDCAEQRTSDDWYALGCLLDHLFHPAGASDLRALALALKARVHTDRSAQAEVADALGRRSVLQIRTRSLRHTAERETLAAWLSPASTSP